MKKNLLGLFSVCSLVMGLASCSTDAIDTTTETATKSSEVNLYLGSKSASSRGCDVNGNEWSADIMPAYPTEEEKAGILEYVRKNPGAKVKWPGYTYYFVQHVTAAHNTYSFTDKNGQTKTTDGSQLDKLEIKEVREYKDWEKEADGTPKSWASLYKHVENFNSANCNNAATHNSALMTEGFDGARAWCSYGSNYCDDWALYYWNGNYYLGIDYKMTKDEGSIAADGIYDDWIVKILPGKGETPVVPDSDGNKDDKKDDQKDDQKDDKKDDDSSKTAKEGEVEFDIHQQIHKDWNEIKTSVHVRDTAAIHINLPIPLEYQAVADDFAIRSGKDYAYTEVIKASFTLAEKEYTFPVKIEHNAAGIDIYIDCTTDEAKEALKIARGVYADGITFEIHSYVKPEVATDQIWEWLKQTKLPDTKTAQWPAVGDICTYTHGQVSSAYKMEEMIKFDEHPQQ